ncbi:MAG: hypothetical protein WDN46_21555 [Methylocella sp.]
MIITAISPALASDKDDAIARVRQAIDAWNKGDTAAVTPHLMPSLVIIDDLAPNHFQGANAVSDWLEAYAADLREERDHGPFRAVVQAMAGHLLRDEIAAGSHDRR